MEISRGQAIFCFIPEIEKTFIAHIVPKSKKLKEYADVEAGIDGGVGAKGGKDSQDRNVCSRQITYLLNAEVISN